MRDIKYKCLMMLVGREVKYRYKGNIGGLIEYLLEYEPILNSSDAILEDYINSKYKIGQEYIEIGIEATRGIFRNE